ncbi:MAG: hypothetical protein A2539_08850 [Elusimicrobia bacterium RIFOXYD2_FULL_34_15]|nr:MAG: hypothetical protein A2539_08850 [Elusimicrobia bacterium RIFOXYD2_FULL_34_15]
MEYYKFKFLGTEFQIHKDWKYFFESVCLECIEKNIERDKITPHKENIFRIFEKLSPKDIKVVIIGQDPYPQPNIATGRAFEVKGLNSWFTPFRQSTLRNILKMLYNWHKSKANSKASRLEKIEIIKNAIEKKDFDILSPDKIFDCWEKQKVFFLNFALTFKMNNSKNQDSHILYWQTFNHELVKYLTKVNKNIVWLLFGKVNEQNAKIIKKNVFYIAHPSDRRGINPADLKKICNFFDTTVKKHKIQWLGGIL